MTDIGYQHLIEKILSSEVEIPKRTFRTTELILYLQGYAKCQQEVIELIRSCMSGQRDT